MKTVLAKSFYARSAVDVARQLLGNILCHESRGILLSGKIVEVEAYLGAQDPASHAYRGMTERNKVMFGPPGHAYIYFTYGSHHCINVVTGEAGEASAVLIRAIEPLEGVLAMKRRRHKTCLEDLGSGPGKVTQAFGIDKNLNGHDLTHRPLWISQASRSESFSVVQTSRIGIREGRDLPYRFMISGCRFVSKS